MSLVDSYAFRLHSNANSFNSLDILCGGNNNPANDCNVVLVVDNKHRIPRATGTNWLYHFATFTGYYESTLVTEESQQIKPQPL